MNNNFFICSCVVVCLRNIWNTWRRYYYTHNLLWTLKYIFNTVTGRAICEEGLCSCTQECSKVLSSFVPTLLCMCSLFLNSYHCHTACFESSLLSLVATVCVLGFHIQTTATLHVFNAVFTPWPVVITQAKLQNNGRAMLVSRVFSVHVWCIVKWTQCSFLDYSAFLL